MPDVLVTAVRCVDCGTQMVGAHLRGEAHSTPFPFVLPFEEVQASSDGCCEECGGKVQFELAAAPTQETPEKSDRAV